MRLGTRTEVVGRGGRYINFDLVYPSKAIPNNFFPSNESLYGYTVRTSFEDGEQMLKSSH
jgi:hypothetical protein